MIKKLTLGCFGILLCVNTSFAKLNDSHTAKVLEFKDAGGYTYIKVDEKGKQYWAAIMKSPVKIGQEITFKEQVVMKNFKSKALNKTFEEVMFAEVPKKGISGADNVHNIHGKMIKKKQEEVKPDVKFNDGIVISKGDAIKTDISDLYKNKEKYKNKNVEVQGHVLQVSRKVMGNTWVKIYNGKDAVIFRSPNEEEKIDIGDKVKVMGTLNTNIDFGYGYKYEILGVNGKFEVLESKK